MNFATTSEDRYTKYASVVLDVSLDKVLSYGIPDDFLDKVGLGTVVQVPLRGQYRKGYIVGIKDSSDHPKVRPLHKVLSEKEFIPPDLFELALWMAKYYCAPLRRVLETMLPSAIRKDAGHKEQWFVKRAKTREELREACIQIRSKQSPQADVLDIMLEVTGGILLSELLEKTKGSKSPIDTLVKKGLLSLEKMRIDRSPLKDAEYFQTKPKPLNPDQAKAMELIIQSLEAKRFDTHLLFGVTGSGKTEVYLQAIDHALKQGRSAIMLVPEISLTSQTIERFRSRFEGHIAILHHRLSRGERFDEWHKIQRGEAKIVIGARSAIFSPVVDLGLIIVDEEHEQSYKQSEEAPCYHARDAAVMRGKMTNSTVILGSATPSIESYYNAQAGKYILSNLHSRADAASFPKVTIVDMQREYEKAGGFTNFSSPLLNGIQQRLQTGELTILFLNRRGYHTTLYCPACRQAVRCSHCDVSMTFHKSDNCLACHLCGYSQSPPPSSCPHCKGSQPVKYRGVGTEQIEKALHAIFKDIRTLRIDADTTKHKGSHQKLLRDFATGKADVLIGTQMIAKGLHFPEVTLVGVLNSDPGLNIPDFRASETTFQLITQVSGRSGRGSLPGEVIIQTSMPDNATIRLAAKQDYESFYRDEIEVRKMFSYPPHAKLVKVAFAGPHQQKTLEEAEQFRSMLLPQLPSDYELYPIVPAGYVKVKDKYRFQFLMRGPNIYVMNRALQQILLEYPATVQINILVDPIGTYF